MQFSIWRVKTVRLQLNRVFKIQKIASWVALFLTTCLIAIACTQSPNPTDSSTSSTVPSEITVASEDDYPPFDFSENGQHIGYNQDLLNYIAKEKSLTIKQEVLPFQGILAGVASDKYMITNAAVGITAKRGEAVDFTMPITESTHYILKRKGDTAINGLKDLANKTIAVQQGGISAAVLEKSVEPELKALGAKVGGVKEYGAFAEAYQDLLNKRVDAVINNIVALKRLVAEKPDLYEIGEQVGPKIYAAWAVKKGNQQILDLFNEGLKAAKESGEMAKLQEKWLKVVFEDMPDSAPTPSV
jgi:polar amino acid transport system substrate-binding protein